MRQFNVGDKVRIREDIRVGDYDECYFSILMKQHSGEIVTIKDYASSPDRSTWFTIVEELDGCNPIYWWSEGMVEPVEEKKVFTANDLKTGMFGVLSTGDKFVVVNGRLVYQDDGYDHIRTMFDNDDSYAYIDKVWEGIWSFRMLDRVLSGKATYGTLVYDYERDTKKYYNGKVVCVQNGYKGSTPVSEFTVGKIYEVKSGVIISNTGYKSEAYCELGNLCCGMGWTFIPLVE